MKASIRVLLMDDSPIACEGIRSVLEKTETIQLVGTVTGDHQTKRFLLKYQPDILLLDTNTSKMDALEAIHITHKYCPKTKILVFSQPCSSAYIQKLLAAGISGYLLKSENPSIILAAIHTVIKGGCCFSQSILATLKQQSEDGNPVMLLLTPRENQVFNLLGEGYNNQQIADQLHLAKQTVANYISCIYEKLGVQSRTEAILWQMKNHTGNQ